MSEVIIDVREPHEFEGNHATNSINVPLSSFNSLAPEILKHFKDSKIVFMCHSGARAMQALMQAKKIGCRSEQKCEVYSGGIIRWMASGQPTEKR